MEAGDKSNHGGPVGVSSVWLHLYGAALTGMVLNDSDGGPEGIARDAADIADAATRVVAERVEIARARKEMVDEQGGDETRS
jgi:hypothetical protein